jgi:DNA-binding transcriptional LysR family regulator
MIQFSLRELESFVAVAEELSFTRAATRLRLAQPPLSRHVRALEDRLGVRLFERSNRSVALTAAGRALYAEVQGPLVQLERAAAAARRAAAGETGRLELGFVSSLLGPDLGELFRTFRAAHPDVQLTLFDRIPHEQLRAIAEGRLDGGFVGLAPATRVAGVVFAPWKTEALWLFVPRSHPLAGRTRVALTAVAGLPLVAIGAEAAPAFASKVQALCRTAGFRPRIVQEASRAQAVVAMVAAGSGVAILPATLAGVAGGAVTALPLRGRGAMVTYVFAHREAPVSSELARFLVTLARAPARAQR